MEEQVQRAGAMSPQKLLVGFSKDRIVFWITIAVAVHIVLIGMLSLGYIRDRWIDPEGAAERKAAAVAAQEALKKEAATKVAKPAAGSSGAATSGVAKASATGTNNGTGVSTGTTAQILEDRKNAPVVKRITEKAQPGDIPAKPDDLGISIGDMNVR